LIRMGEFRTEMRGSKKKAGRGSLSTRVLTASHQMSGRSPPPPRRTLSRRNSHLTTKTLGGALRTVRHKAQKKIACILFNILGQVYLFYGNPALSGFWRKKSNKNPKVEGLVFCLLSTARDEPIQKQTGTTPNQKGEGW